MARADTSDESKEHSRQVLNELGGENAFYSEDKQGDDAPAANMGGQGNILGGHKGRSSMDRIMRPRYSCVPSAID